MKKKITITLLLCVCAIFCALGFTACFGKSNENKVTGVTLNKTELTLNVGESEKLTVSVLPETAVYSEVYWSSEDVNIASVDETGNVTATSQGTTKVTVMVNGIEAACTVTVKQPADWVNIHDGNSGAVDKITLAVGGEETFTATIYPENSTSEVEWSVDLPEVASVDNGKVTALSQGIAIVTATADGVSDSITVTVTEDGVQYSISDDGQSYTVVGIYAALVEKAKTEVVVASEFNGKPVTSIGNFAFYLMRELVSIKLPASVTVFDESQLIGCTALESIAADEANTVFTTIDGVLYNKALTEIIYVPISIKGEVTVPQTVTAIGSGTFKDRVNMTNVILPDSITSIGNSAFSGCTGLHSFTVPENVTKIDSYAFSGCVKLWEIYNLSDLEIVTGGDDWTATHGMIGMYALKVFTDENEPSGLNYTDDGYAFYTLNDKVYLVEYTGSETELQLPLGYRGENYEIGQYAFYGCENITSVSITYKVTAIGAYAFYDCVNLVRVGIGSGVESIGDYAFHNCNKLESINIPDGVKSVGEFAFESCDSLTSAVVGNGLTKISDGMFYGCSALQKITLQNSITYIDSRAIWYCTSLEEIIFNGTEEQWNAIRKFENWDIHSAEYTVNCTVGSDVSNI